ncbi:hypothetical protein [Scandinavium hiltneri]|nr:hypothetical protein [Scandinavium hiltneri]
MINSVTQYMDECLSMPGYNFNDSTMYADLPRMNYYIDNVLISVPGNKEASYHNLIRATSTPGHQWIQEKIRAISTFLHQAIFIDVYNSIPEWKCDRGEPWHINLVSLDNARTSNNFFISSSGEIKFICIANVCNIMFTDGTFRETVRNTSKISLQYTFRVVTDHREYCILRASNNAADKIILALDIL